MKIFSHLDRDGDTSKKIILICSLGRLSHLLEEPPDASDSLDFIQFLDSLKNICLVIMIPDIKMKTVATLVLDVTKTRKLISDSKY